MLFYGQNGRTKFKLFRLCTLFSKKRICLLITGISCSLGYSLRNITFFKNVPWLAPWFLRITLAGIFGKNILPGMFWRHILAAYFGGIFWRHILAAYFGGIFWRHILAAYFSRYILAGQFWREYFGGNFLAGIYFWAFFVVGGGYFLEEWFNVDVFDFRFQFGQRNNIKVVHKRFNKDLQSNLAKKNQSITCLGKKKALEWS